MTKLIREITTELFREVISEPTGKLTPFMWLNEKTGGITPGELITIAARTGSGKSTFALQTLHHIANYNKVLYATLEMPETQQLGRIVARVSDISQKDIARHRIPDIELFKKVLTSIANSRAGQNMYMTRHARTTQSLAAELSRTGAAVVAIDTLNLMQGRGESERVKVTNITRELKQIALEKDVAVVMIAQLNRDVDDADTPPSLKHLKESGSIEEDSDVVLLFWEPTKFETIEKIQAINRVALCTNSEYEQMREDNNRAVVASLKKNRSGETGVTMFWYQPAKFQFMDIAEARERHFKPW